MPQRSTGFFSPVAALVTGIFSLIGSLSVHDFAAFAGGVSACIGGGYAAWRWYNEWQDRRRKRSK